MTVLKLTKIPQLNSIVVRQEGGHFFIAAPNSFIIDKAGLLQLIEELVRIDFLDVKDLAGVMNNISPVPEDDNED